RHDGADAWPSLDPIARDPGPERGASRLVIAPWMRLVPCARGSDDRLEVPEPWRPAQLALRLVRRRVEDGRVARTPRRERPRHLPAGDALDRVDHFEHRMRAAGSEVVRPRLARLGDGPERPDVRVREIGDMNVVAQTRAIRRRIVIAEHLQAGPSGRRGDGARDHVNL